jgi:hypothetical protein
VDVGLRSFWSPAHQHRLSAYIGPCIPNGLISHKHAVGVSVRKKLQCRDSGFVQSSKIDLQGNRPPKAKNRQIRLLEQAQSSSPFNSF